jgi:phosphotransferase system IIB component
MTLSLETIRSIPLLEFKLNKKLINDLETSESTNKVFKKNAGVKQFNVKHSQELQVTLNNILTPEYSKILTELHENSEFTRLIESGDK